MVFSHSLLYLCLCMRLSFAIVLIDIRIAKPFIFPSQIWTSTACVFEMGKLQGESPQFRFMAASVVAKCGKNMSIFYVVVVAVVAVDVWKTMQKK